MGSYCVGRAHQVVHRSGARDPSPDMARLDLLSAVLPIARRLTPSTSEIRVSSQAFWFGVDTALAAFRMRA